VDSAVWDAFRVRFRATALDPDPVFRAVLGAEFAVLNGIDLDLEAIERVRAHTRPAGIASRPQ
jgi:hypothetical protein